MRIGSRKKIFAGIGMAAGAIILAPVVLPAAAAAGATALAAGSAVAGTVGAVGATVGTAAASSAVGTAAIGAMTTVGTAVGAAAGSVGLASVATVVGTEAGAAAVGTIATSVAIGGSSALSGASKMNEASNIKNEAEHMYDKARGKFDAAEKETNEDLEELGKTKVHSWELLVSYVESFEKIKNITLTDEVAIDGQLELDKNEMENVKVLAFTMKDVIKDGAASLAGGQLIGLAASSGFASIATASTGTAIAGLSGAAATNASLAALGGGSLATGGLGMAGGAVVANALTFAPALAITGIFVNKKGKENLQSANEIMSEAKKLCANLDKAVFELDKLDDLSNRMNNVLKNINNIFNDYCTWISELVSKETNYTNYSNEEKKKLMVGYKIAAIIKEITCTQLINEDNKVETEKVDTMLLESKEKLTFITREKEKVTV